MTEDFIKIRGFPSLNPWQFTVDFMKLAYEPEQKLTWAPQLIKWTWTVTWASDIFCRGKRFQDYLVNLLKSFILFSRLYKMRFQDLWQLTFWKSHNPATKNLHCLQHVLLFKFYGNSWKLFLCSARKPERKRKLIWIL